MVGEVGALLPVRLTAALQRCLPRTLHASGAQRFMKSGGRRR